MKLLNLIAISAILLSSCSDKSKDGANGKEDENTTSGSEKSITCSETNSLKIESDSVFLNEFKYSQVKSVNGGWNFSGKQCPKTSIYFSNYNAELTSLSIKTPKNEGEYLIEVAFTGAPNASGEKLPYLEAGEYPAGSHWDGNPGFSVVIYDNSGMSMTEFFDLDKSTGNGTISNINKNKVCGSVSLKDENGNTIEASFSLDIVKDTWEEFR